MPFEGVEIIARLVPRPVAETQENRLEMTTNQYMGRKGYVVHMLTRPVSTTGCMIAFSNNVIAWSSSMAAPAAIELPRQCRATDPTTTCRSTKKVGKETKDNF